MSTVERFGGAVWRGVVSLVEADESGWGYMTVGEVAEEAEVSKPTAKKYLDMLCEKEVMTFFQTRSGVRLYRLIGKLDG